MKTKILGCLVALLTGLLVAAGMAYLGADAKAEKAKTALATLKLQVAEASKKSEREARIKEKEANETQATVVEDLQKQLDSRDGRIAALLRRVWNNTSSGSGGNNSTSTQTTNSADGSGDTGLRGMDGQDLVLTEASQESLAEFAVSANTTKEYLLTCRLLLHQAWKMTN